MEQYINVIGGGLAGTEAAYQIAKKVYRQVSVFTEPT